VMSPTRQCTEPCRLQQDARLASQSAHSHTPPGALCKTIVQHARTPLTQMTNRTPMTNPKEGQLAVCTYVRTYVCMYAAEGRPARCLLLPLDLIHAQLIVLLSSPLFSSPLLSSPLLVVLLSSGLVWSGLVWSGLVWSGLVWSGLVWSGLFASPLLSSLRLSSPRLSSPLLSSLLFSLPLAPDVAHGTRQYTATLSIRTIDSVI